MKLYTYQITTKIGPFERIGAELNGKISTWHASLTFLRQRILILTPVPLFISPPG
jgi:hypothetical protein